MSDKFEISIGSPPDREKLIAEIRFGTRGAGYATVEEALANPPEDMETVAEINQESDQLQIELYLRRSGEPWVFSYAEFMEALNQAKRRLVGGD